MIIDPKFASDMASPLWRLRSFYKCRREGGGKGIPFHPRPEQMMLYEHFEECPTDPAYIIKSRRLGMSTAINVYQGDASVFRGGWRGILIDKTQADATKKMVEQLRFSVKSLPPEILRLVRFDKENDNELRLRVGDETENEDSVLFATVSGRGGDCNMLHVSEMGPIAAKDPPRAEEIRTGAFPAARMGRRVVETTWYGGKVGVLWEMIKPILEQDPNAHGKIFFFPWHADPMAISTAGVVTRDLETYFKDLADKLGKSFSPEQKKWYGITRQEQGIFMRREYPSTLDEAFSAPVEGSIYGADIEALRVAGGIVRFEVDKTALVHTAWDLGAPLNVATWYFQVIAGQIRILDCDLDLDLTSVERVSRMMARGWPLGHHFVPHDATAKNISGGTPKSELEKAGLVNVTVVPRTHDVWVGINGVKQLFPRFVFRAPACDEALARLGAYRTPTEGKTDEPVHDRNSHPADALRMMADAIRLDLLPGHAGVVGRPRRPVEVVWGVGG